SDVDMADVAGLEVPVELRLELRPIVGLNRQDAKGQPAQHLVDEADRGPLGARVVDLQDAKARAIIDGGELIQPATRSRNALQKLDVELQAVSRLRLLIPLPALPVPLVLLIRREAMHSVPAQDAVHRGARDANLVEPLQVRRDAAWPEVIVLAQIQDLADDLPRGGARRPMRRPWAVAESRVAVLGVPSLPLVEGLPGAAVPAADTRHIPFGGRLAQDFQPPRHEPGLLTFRHPASAPAVSLKRRAGCVTSVSGFHMNARFGP